MKTATFDMFYELTTKHPNYNSNITEISVVPFDDDELILINKDDEPYVDIAQICRNLDTHIGKQWLILHNNPDSGLCLIKAKHNGEIYNAYCIPLFKLNDWLKSGFETNKTCIYVIKNENNLVKIGFSSQPKKRLKTLESQGGYKIIDSYISDYCFEYMSIEKAMHNLFKSGRTIGEWFEIDFDDAVKELKRMIAQMSNYDGFKLLQIKNKGGK
ncbi:MAG: GIY-YIG nuclease family protein [Saprospiraceae bacterium]